MLMRRSPDCIFIPTAGATYRTIEYLKECGTEAIAGGNNIIEGFKWLKQ